MTPNPPNALSTLSDWELNDLFAVEVLRSQPESVECCNYCADANAVLPLLNKHRWNCFHSAGKFEVEIDEGRDGNPFGISLSFARSAVIALLTAKRAETK